MTFTSKPSFPTAALRAIIITSIATALAALVAIFGSVDAATAATAMAAPANDTQSSAQVIHSLPASLTGTTVGATTEVGEPGSQCVGGTESSVWYSVRSSGAQRIAVDLAASGALDATVDVYHAVRSQLTPVECDRTDSHGKASLSFKASKNGLYLIRVAAQEKSQLAPFSLEVFLPTPAVNPPGLPLPAGGVGGQVDPIQNVNAAYAVTLHAGVS